MYQKINIFRRTYFNKKYQKSTEYNADFSELYCLAQALSAVMSILPDGNRNNHMTSREMNDMIKTVRNYEVNENEGNEKRNKKGTRNRK